MDLHNDAVKALEFPPKEDKRDFGDIDEERSTKEEDILASLMEDFMDGDFWKWLRIEIIRNDIKYIKFIFSIYKYLLRNP